MTEGGWKARGLRLYDRLARLLPEGMACYRREAREDLSAILDDARERGGWTGALVAYGSALGDLSVRIVTERVRGLGSTLSDPPAVLPAVGLAGRMLRRQPFFSAVVVVTLTLGVTATVSVFSAVDTVLLRPLEYPDAGRIVDVRHHAPLVDLPNLGSSPGMARFYRELAPFFEHQAVVDPTRMNLTGSDEPVRVDVAAVSPSIFDVLRVQPAMGRRFTPEDERPGRDRVAILAHDAWIGHFGGDPEVLDRSVRLDGRPYDIVGVMPPDFAFPDDETVALVPFEFDPNGAFGDFGLFHVARISEGISFEQARSELEALQARVGEYFDLGPDFLEQAGWSVSMETLRERRVAGVRAPLLLLMGTVVFVLLIAATNVANLFLVRAETRRKEIAVRVALGGDRAHVRSLWFGESLMLCGIAGLLSLVLVQVVTPVLVNSAPSQLPRFDEVTAGWRVVGFAGLVTLLAAFGFTAVPLLRSRGGDEYGSLNASGRGSTGGRAHHRTRSLLVATQLALALVLMTGSGLLLRSVQKLQAVDPGFDPEGVATLTLSRDPTGGGAEGAVLFDRIADEVAALPGVRSVGLGSLIPLGSGSATGGSFHIESRPREEDELPTVAMYSAIGADYVETLGMELLEGRDLTEADWRGGEPVMLVNETMARRFLEGRALGEGIRWDEDKMFARVVGIVADVQQMELEEEPGAWAYVPMVVGDWGYPNLETMTLFVRMEPGISFPARAARETVRRVDPTVPIVAQFTMEEVVDREVAPARYTLILLGGASLVALLLGAVGLFGATAYLVSRRTRELGIRIALGARPRQVRTMVVRQGIAVACLGAVVGIAAAMLLSRFMSALLFAVSPHDPVTYGSVTVGLLLVAALATYLPARRASAVSPVEALTHE